MVRYSWLLMVALSLFFCKAKAYAADLFPDKIEVTYASGFSVSYHDTYKVIKINRPWRGAADGFEYVLVARGSTPPEGFARKQIIEIPVRRFVLLSTAFVGHVDVLGLQEALVGLSDFKFVSTPSVIEMIEQGRVVEVGHGSALDMEQLVDLAPDLIMATAYGDPQNDVHPKLAELGLPVVVNGDYMETHPLGRAEWLKFTALFFNKEAVAQQRFDAIAQAYESLAKKGQAVADRPTVFTDASWRGTWFVPGGKSFMAQLIHDAGANYIWRDDPTTGGLPLDFEVVLERAKNADYWINPGTWRSIADALDADERHAEFKALQTNRVYNRNARVNAGGGNDFWESGLVQPHLVLADLMKIFHPELVPTHTFIWYRQLDPLEP